MKNISGINLVAIAMIAIVPSVSSCPYLPHPHYECGPNEEYSECGTACPETCNTPPLQACTLQCVQGCFCKAGFVREHENGACIPKCHCPHGY
uniref:TIL domain-containing protein n=1 Tax=Anopheles atroparvus TaxID=41427 RepID=A0AAG5D522_ANOAO